MQLVYLFIVFVPFVHSEHNSVTDNLINSPCTDQNHFFLAPGVLTAGAANRACVSRFYPEGPAHLLLSLVTEDGKTVTTERDLPPGDGGCVDISVPMLPNTKADLISSIKYPEAHCTWERRLALRIASGRVLVVHTERARYRPGDTVRARVFAMKADLTPAYGNIDEVWIEGPPGAWEGTRVAQWTQVRTRLGLAQLQHEVDDLAPPGKWTLRARLADGTQGLATFYVGNYELPPFQLSVRHAPRVLRTSERLAWTVCVRYPWSEAVEGMLVIRLRGAGGSGGSGGVRTAVRLRAPRACHRHAAAARRVGLAGATPPRVLVADFSFQEEGTRVWQNTTVVSQVVDKPIFLEFITKQKTVVTPGLPYKLKVKATRWDDKPAVSERIRVCRFPSLGGAATETNKPTCNFGDTDASGVARVMFAAEDDGSPFYRFEANLSNDTSIKCVPLTLATRRSKTQAALGPLRADSRGTRTFVPLYLNLQNVTTPVTVHFVVITRGGIIYRWGTTTQCPISSTANHIQTATRNSKCIEAMPLTDRNKPEKNNHDRISDYFNKIVNRQNMRNAERANQNRKNFNKDTESINKKTSFDEYLSRYVTQIKHNVDNKENNDVKFNENNTFKYTNLNDRSTETNEKSNDTDAFEGSESDALLDRYLLRVMLPIKVTPQMCPNSHLIAYFYRNGEFVSASKHFAMDDCFVNKVDISWQSRQVLPGSASTLQISTPGPAICALTVLDSSSKWTPMASVRDVFITGLKKMMESHRNLTEYDAAGDCFLNEETPELPNSSLELTAAWLASAGVRVAGDLVMRRQCEPAAMTDERTVARSDFSEAWLWRLVTVGANSSTTTTAKAPDSITRFEANAICLTKMGVAVAQPAVLQVLREFFIHADSPRRLRRGDNTIIRYRLFNYLYEPLSVQIQILTDPHLQGPTDLVESVCVPPRASTARRSEITATGQGEGRVIIRAKAVNDGGCGNRSNGRGVSDEVILKITVEPEGVPVNEQKSTLLCGKDTRDTLSSKSEVSWSWAHVDSVPGTESLTVWAIGNLTGPLLADSDSLVLLPRGCGEQNMARLATNLLALTHLHPTCAAAAAAREHVARGYTRQFQYIHPSGGFSAFGPSDPTASTWLTAFCLRYLRRAHQTLYPGLPTPPAIERAEQWLLAQQMENGCFRNEGQVFHRELRGGLNEEGEIASVALTAYVITSLIESTSPLPSRVITNTLSCLRALPPLKYQTPTRIYAHSLLAYAFVRLKRYEEEVMSNEALESLKGEGLVEVMELVKMGRKEGEYLWWDTSSLSTSIEATSYALLSLRESPSPLQQSGAGAVRWLAAHRAASGGFVSTQDTLVALEALSSWSSLQPSPTNLTVTATSSKTVVASLTPEMLVPEVMKMDGDSVKIKVEGSGCALVQATRSYNSVSAPARAGSLSLQLRVRTEGEFDCDAAGNCYCAAVVEACVVWSGTFPEMALLEITLPGGYEADAKRLYSQLHQPDSLIRRIELSPSNSRATLYLAGDGRAPACAALHAAGPRARTAPARASLAHYYRPSVNHTQMYTIPEDCPARVSHDASQEMKDNIYSKARSLTDSSEILINHDFDFDDIPEGIPLEDPLYENLKDGEVKDDKIKTEEVSDNDKVKQKHINVLNIAQKLESPIIQNVIVNGNEIQSPGSKVLVFDDKLNLSEEKYNIEQQYQTEKNSIPRFDKVNAENIDHRVATDLTQALDLKVPSALDNEMKNIHRIETRDDQHESHRVDNPNLSDFHIIDSDKDLEVPTGVEGPIPAMVLPPPNFVPPNYVHKPDNFNHNSYTPSYDANSQSEGNSESGSRFRAQDFAQPLRLIAPNDNFGWYGSNQGYFGTPYRRNFRSR